jgi:hypothetical protein
MPMTREAFLSALQILGMPPGSGFSTEDIQRQYRKTMNDWHPDHNPDWRAETDEHAKKINEARKALLDWIKEGRPGWPSAEQGRSRDETASARPETQPRPPPEQSGSPASPSEHSVRGRLFSFYWYVGFLPHWRILLLPLGIIVAWSLFGPQGSAPPSIGSSGPVSSGVPREQTAQAPVITTVRSADHYSTLVKYGAVPYPAFLPDLGPLTDKYPLPLYVSMSKSEIGVVWEMIVQKYDRLDDLGFVDGHSDKLRARMEQDINSIVAQNALILECRYYTGRDVGKFGIFRYWYRFRPVEAEPGHLRSIVPDHPLLLVRAARNNCPSTRREADDTQ